MSTIIFIEGNLASGKSTYADHLARVLECEVVSIDYFRSYLWQKGTTDIAERERMARTMMAAKLRNTAPLTIVERIGTGQFDALIDEHVEELGYRCFRVLINLPPRECIIRYMARRPPCYPLPRWMSDSEEYIYATAQKLGDKALDTPPYDAYIHNQPGSITDNLRTIVKRYAVWRDKPP